MGKRAREDVDDTVPNKRLHVDVTDRVSALSDELLLVLLSYLPEHDLIHCELLSRRMRSLASDSQLWKSAYYERFVRPRAVRIPGLREARGMEKSLLYSSKFSKWLEDGHLVGRGGSTNWKRQYKLRHNWSRGNCRRSETEIAEGPSVPPLLLGLHEGIVVTAEPVSGLKAWQTRGDKRLVASMTWSRDCPASTFPSSLAIDTSSSTTSNLLISVGFLDGSFGVFALDRRRGSLACRYMHAPSPNGTLTAIAFSFPYILTMTGGQLLSLYTFTDTEYDTSNRPELDPPKLLSSLQSNTAWPPLSLAMRYSSAGISASIAYVMPRFIAGWSVGLQELRLADDGTILDSRLATALSEGFVPLLPAELRNGVYHDRSDDADFSLGTTPRHSTTDVYQHRLASSSTKPTSLSYNHPYLLVTYSNNTMTLHMVTSSTKELSIGPARRLWGHTSSVSGAYVGDRGKAVSVSAYSNDLRVWELEGGVISNAAKQRRDRGFTGSVLIKPDSQGGAMQTENEPPEHGTKCWAQKEADEATINKGWVSFDDEQVILLGEKRRGALALVAYDFA
ncbi:MAG: hypothetical protein L6R35_002228 [Caloplaca aegaea]|nr:MAG: hypothetical protein L6R35_002228 [Caloplaca aegaea]